MTYTIDRVVLLTAIASTITLANELILALKREAWAVTGNGGVVSSNLIETKESFFTAFARVRNHLLEHPDALAEPVESIAFGKLQSLVAEMVTASLDTLIENHSEIVKFRFERAGIRMSQGRCEEAQQDYLLVLKQEPTHFGALNDLAIIQTEIGQLNVARAFFLQAVTAHPEQSIGHVNFADFLLSQAEYDAAKSHYQVAIELNPNLKEAQQGLSHALAGLGDEAGAALHRELGFRGQEIITWPYTGGGASLPVVVLGSAFSGNVPIKYALDKQIFQSTVIFVEYFDPATPLPPHRLVVNLIGDADLCQPGLEIAELVLKGSTVPVINHPALVRLSGRLNNARRLGVLPGVTTARTALLSRVALMSNVAEDLLAKHGIGFPLLLRSPGFQTGQFFVCVETVDDLAKAVCGLPGQDLLAMQVLDARNRQGVCHKYRVMFVDGVLYPLHLAISQHWKVHYFSADMANQPEYRVLEAAFLEDMAAVLGDKAIIALENIRQALGLDYGGIDFALGSDGGILLFEANANMVVQRPDNNEKWGYRRVSTERILKAIQSMVINRAS